MSTMLGYIRVYMVGHDSGIRVLNKTHSFQRHMVRVKGELFRLSFMCLVLNDQYLTAFGHPDIQVSYVVQFSDLLSAYT